MSYSSLSIGLFIFIMAFFMSSQSSRDLITSVFTPELAPKQTTVSLTNNEVAQPTQFCQTVGTDAPTFQAPADNTTKTGSEDDESLGTPIITKDCKSKGPRHQFGPKLSTYRLIRKNVPLSRLTSPDRSGDQSENFTDEGCHFDSADKLGINIDEIDKTKFKIFFPQIAGEISLDTPVFSRTRNRESDLFYFIDYGLIFLLHKNENGGFTELQGGTTQGKSATFYLADIYQDIDSGRPELPPEALTCDTTRGAAIAKGPSVIQPPQQAGDSSQLQLQYFVFGSATGSSQVTNGWGIHCKPAIYLYPNQTQLVNVKVKTKGFLTYVDPPYDNQKGWTVEANPNGLLTTTQSLSPLTYPYLYYESKLPRSMVKKPEQGWIIKKEHLPKFFESTMPKLGLNQKESKDFKDYWSKTLTTHPYFFIGILDQDLINYLEPLEISPKPDSINRVRLYFQGLENPVTTTEPSVISHQSSAEGGKLKAESNLIVSEWGGVVDTGKDKLFVCNQ